MDGKGKTQVTHQARREAYIGEPSSSSQPDLEGGEQENEGYSDYLFEPRNEPAEALASRFADTSLTTFEPGDRYDLGHGADDYGVVRSDIIEAGYGTQILGPSIEDYHAYGHYQEYPSHGDHSNYGGYPSEAQELSYRPSIDWENDQPSERGGRGRKAKSRRSYKREKPFPFDKESWKRLLTDADAGEEELKACLKELGYFRNPLRLTNYFKALVDILDLVPEKLLEQVTPDLRGQHTNSHPDPPLLGAGRGGRMAQVQKILTCQWELPTVFSDILPGKKKCSVREMFAQHLVITGSNGLHKCTSCQEIATTCWGSAGDKAISVLSEALSQTLEATSDFRGSLPIHGGRKGSLGNVSYFATPSVLVVSFFGPPDDNQLLDAICWICSAVRNTDKEARPKDAGGPLLSRAVRYKATQSNPTRSWLTTYEFCKLHPLEAFEIEGSSSSMCWTGLFKSVSIVESSINRAWGRGLEIPFPLMMELAAVENVCTVEGRTALLGFHTALIPTQREESANLVQWHFLDIDPGEGPLLPTHVSGFVESGWLKLGTEIMKSMTCFLGWASHANIMLGTEELVEREAKMRSCRNLELGKAHWEKEQLQLGFQVSVGVTVADLIGQTARTWKWTKDTIERTPSSEYQQALNEARRKTCLLIDSQSKQAWLVPLLSVLFHLCHRYYQINRRLTSDEQTPLPYIQPTADGEEAVFDAIGHQHDLKVGSVHLSALFHTLYLNLIQYPRLNCADYVYANDLMDVVENTRSYPRKVPLTGNGYCWPDLLPFAEASHAVAVCANIGQVLQVQQSLGDPLCQCKGSLLCYQLPQGRSYFAAHVASLNRLCDNDPECQDVVYSGCELPPRYRIFGSGASWAPQTDPWRSIHCRGTPVWAKKATANRVLQETSPDSLRKKLWNKQLNIQAFTSAKGSSLGRGPPTPPLLGAIPENGVVVFGRYKDH